MSAVRKSSVRPVSSSRDDRIDGILPAWRWSSDELTYSAPTSSDDYADDFFSDWDENDISAEFQDFSPLSNRQLFYYKSILDSDFDGADGYAESFSVESLTELEFEFSNAANPNDDIAAANSGDYSGAYAYLPGTTSEAGRVFFGTIGVEPEEGNDDHLTMLHEIGHALGLLHGHEESEFGAVPNKYDSNEYTVMTYKSYVGEDLGDGTTVSPEFWGRPQTYMMLDIAALQHLYGANYDANSGDTVYSWKPGSGKTKIDGESAIDPGANRIYATIWDGGGTDTYDLSRYERGVDIDLRPGKHSVFSNKQLADIGGDFEHQSARGNIFNALKYDDDRRSLIENALGGEGNDRIVGNGARNRLEGGEGRDELIGRSGSDRLLGGKGSDTLTGDNGRDRLYGGNAHDEITGGAGADIIKGGKGDDTFVFLDVSDSTPDDFDILRPGGSVAAFEKAGRADGDVIDVSEIDANNISGGDQSFSFNQGTGRADLWLEDDSNTTNTLVFGNIDGDVRAEFYLVIRDGSVEASDYHRSDFIL